ncbi:4'-phosphopantetheinyl transferase superfamily protein (plasmid) [Enterobacteriaceae bacterium Kacie_13]|nr:4'-phosphopantetheinyl transferase superfamily protein [Enterobacteriaceae bacterium Kacie_13]
MPESFITAAGWLNLPPESGHSGKIARCHFTLAAYRDDLFTELAVFFPPFLTRAVPKRRAEFLAGRYLATMALTSLGQSPVTVGIGEDRSPLWPENVYGSISHNAHTALCAVQTGGGVGIDVETLMEEQQARDFLPMIINGDEHPLLCRHQHGSLAALMTLTFSAKESLFKMIYPQTGKLFGFLDAKLVALDEEECRFTLELTRTLSAIFPAGRRFEGVYQWDQLDVITFISEEIQPNQ